MAVISEFDTLIVLAQARQIGQDNLTISNHMEQVLTNSPKGHSISVFKMGAKNLPTLVLIGGVHGDEPEGAQIVQEVLKRIASTEAQFKVQLLAIPNYNPDGLKDNQRTNGNGVDLNRNFPSTDWSANSKAPRYFPGPKANSEPETQALVKLLEQHKPFLVIHCHTYVPQIVYTGESALPYAKILAKNFGHPVKDDIGYPTPGSLGQYCLQILKTPCICIELPEQVEPGEAWNLVGNALLEIIYNGPQ